MKLIELQETKKRVIYINPEKVKLVRPHNENVTIIMFQDNGAVTVQHGVDEVVRKLQESNEY